ncbi:MAG: hypothetical protein LBU32_26895 [Clostridiales bacterium]|nr:hypothetical protein [Clostridiales bacterium]
MDITPFNGQSGIKIGTFDRKAVYRFSSNVPFLELDYTASAIDIGISRCSMDNQIPESVYLHPKAPALELGFMQMLSNILI